LRVLRNGRGQTIHTIKDETIKHERIKTLVNTTRITTTSVLIDLKEFNNGRGKNWQIRMTSARKRSNTTPVQWFLYENSGH
jgi:hypothetical protein